MNILMPKIPQFKLKSPELVLSMDKIRFELENKNPEEFDEFCWFAREYPRCFRHYYECSEYRLKNIITIYNKYSQIFKKEIEMSLKEENSLLFELAQSNIETKLIYWEFESFLSSISTSLDIMSRICGLENTNQTATSFTKYCKKEKSEISSIFNKAKNDWINELKNYRDCFTHYTPVDTILSIKAIKYKNDWRIICKIPDNPNSRDIINFNYSKKKDLLTYALKVYRKFNQLDKIISKKVLHLYKENKYPVRINNLFNIGTRE